MSKTFSVVCGNPPYQANQKKTAGLRCGKQALWIKFVNKALDLCEDGGHISFIHPQQWRAPENKLLEGFKKRNLVYCEFHDHEDGLKTFGAATRYDWYVLKNDNRYKSTKIKDIDGNINDIDISSFAFLPSGNFNLIKKLIGNGSEQRQQILYSRSAYGSDKKWMKNKKDNVYKNKCIHSIKEDGTYSSWYSSKTDNGFFGTPKVIISKFINSSFKPAIIDIDGAFGMTQVPFAIPVDSEDEAEQIKRAFSSKNFNELVSSLKLGYFEISPKTWSSFKKDFWKEFV